MIDTHREVESLITAGFDKEKAEAVVKFYMSKNETVATKIDVIELQHKVESSKSELQYKIEVSKSDLEAKIDSTESKLEFKIEKLESKIDLINSNIGWLKVINIAILTTVLGVAFVPIAQNMFKPPVQEVIPVIPSKK